MIASSDWSISASHEPCFARVVAGATTTVSRPAAISRKRSANMGSAVMWSTGISKKPCTWPAWRSMVRTRSAPTPSIMFATIRAVIGSRGADFRSWRA